jgi:hypothetical protein
MAIVANLADPGGQVDKSYENYNRTNAGEPNASVTPEFAGEIILDTTNNVLWKALGVGNDTWVMLTGSL